MRVDDHRRPPSSKSPRPPRPVRPARRSNYNRLQDLLRVCVCVCKSTDGSQVSICVNWTDRIDRGIIILSTRHFIYIRAGLPGSVALEVHPRS